MKTIKLDDGEYEVIDPFSNIYRDDIVLRKLPSNPMPELSVGDWVFDKIIGMYEIHEHDLADPRTYNITEIRFADGRIWRRS